MDRLKKNSRMRKLKPQENNSKLKQKTQGFGKFKCNLLQKLTEMTKKGEQLKFQNQG